MSDALQNPLYLVVALQSEANPLIEQFSLKAVRNGPLRYFERDTVRLMISGIGKTSTAAATAALLHGRDDLDKAVCLNIGIAGHASLDLGTLFVAHRISDVASGKHWFPPLTFNPPCPTSQLDTLDAPSGVYPDNTGLDMEAAAFYPVASRYTEAELTQVVKIVSDTPEHSLEALDKQRVTQLVGDALPAIGQIVGRLDALACRQFDASPIRKRCDQFAERWHLTVSQQNTLRRLLERHQALFRELPSVDSLARAANGKALLKQLESSLVPEGGRAP
ncbi:MAG: hypothetical protein KDJ38_07475 [Gammaproteobacteria bacterium]|nr:hypothetical protein [Gammaproteobacteria bacterium]